MKLLLDLPGQLNDELLVLDLLTLSTSRVRTKRASSCPDHAISRATAAQAAAVAQANAAAASAATGTSANRSATSATGVVSGGVGANLNPEMSFDTLDQAYDAGFDIVDIREPKELEEMPTPTSHSRNIPMAELLHGQPPFAPAGKTLLVCASGRRSLAATQELRERGFADIYSLRGGVKGLQARLLT
jgi:adenylyltransferase/sulfurtransferase